MEAVRIINKSDKVFQFTNGRTYVLPPGDNTVVFTHVAKCYFGDWELRNTDPYRRPRDDDYSRLQVLYGAYGDNELWEANKPAEGVCVEDLDGNRITTLIEDPTGEGLAPDTSDEERTRLAVMLERSNSEVKALQARLESLEQHMTKDMPPMFPSEEDPPIIRRPPPRKSKSGMEPAEEDLNG